MAQSLSKIYVHIIFSTKNRVNFISDDLVPELYSYLAGIIKAYDCNILKIGGMPNHIHILCVLSRKYSLSKLMEEIKKSSSKWIKTKAKNLCKFSWQNGYGAFSISQSQIEIAKKYIENQKEHHKQISFKDELVKLLQKYEIDYDEKYLWD